MTASAFNANRSKSKNPYLLISLLLFLCRLLVFLIQQTQPVYILGQRRCSGVACYEGAQPIVAGPDCQGRAVPEGGQLPRWLACVAWHGTDSISPAGHQYSIDAALRDWQQQSRAEWSRAGQYGGGQDEMEQGRATV